MNAPKPGVEFQPLDDFRDARSDEAPAQRLAEVRQRATTLREKWIADGEVTYFRSLDLATQTWPVKYGLQDIPRLTLPYMNVVQRLFVVQYDTRVGIRTLLFNAVDLEGAQRTPAWRDVADSVLATLVDRILVPAPRTVEDALASTGINPSQVDYLAWPDLRAQDLRRWLGTKGRKGFFPNARLLVSPAEWSTAQAPLPSQAMWYCPDGLADIDRPKVITLEGDTRLGSGVALLSTPGRTAGSWSLLLNTADGPRVVSANGVAADNWSPESSEISGLPDYARRFNVEAIPDGIAPESAGEQYLSMVQEKVLAGPAAANPAFAACVPVAELVDNLFLPGLAPTLSCGEVTYGSPVIA